MHVYTNVFGFVMPTYGLMIAMGVVFANLAGLFVLKYEHLDFNDFMVLEAYAMLGAYIGAKILYLAVTYRQIDWNRILDYKYLNNLMLGGFVFYGGMIGGFLFIHLGGRIHRIQTKEYIKDFIFLIPFIHCFGRIGCFMAGCCYGVPYHQIGAVVFPEGSYAPPGIELFPIQLVESGCLMMIAIFLLFQRIVRRSDYTTEMYFLLYGIIRFILEYFRYDAVRGRILFFSTSQWISVCMVVISAGMFVEKRRRIKSVRSRLGDNQVSIEIQD